MDDSCIDESNSFKGVGNIKRIKISERAMRPLTIPKILPPILSEAFRGVILTSL
jgi:hypothetical protein